MHRPSLFFKSAMLLSVALILSSCAARQPEFARYVTDDPYFNFPSNIRTALIYKVENSKEELMTKITAESGNRLRHTYLNSEEEQYDIDQYSAEGLLEERRSYRGGDVVLTNVYKSTAIGVPVIDYQVERSGSKQQTWIAEADAATRTIIRRQAEAIPFITNQDITYTYNEPGQLTSVVHKFPTRLFTENYFYDSRGNVIRYEEKRTDRESSGPTITEYTFDSQGNWITSKTTMASGAGWAYRREIEYWSDVK